MASLITLWWLICIQWFGYVLAWPPTLSSVDELVHVDRVTPLKAWRSGRHRSTTYPELTLDRGDVINGIDSWLIKILWAKTRGPDASPWHRVLVQLDGRNLLGTGVGYLPKEEANAVDPAFRHSIFIAPSRDNPDSLLSDAVVIEGRNSGGQAITMVAAIGSGSEGKVPYYEAAFDGFASEIGPDTLIDSQRFNYFKWRWERGREREIQLILLGALLVPGVIAAVIYADILRRKAHRK
ncbi:MAG: hypothetical protein AAF333_02175 [Planctomycetota bacterium]